MIDYTTDIRKRLSLAESMPEELVQKRATVLDKLKELQADIKPLMDCIGEIQARDTMKDSKMLVNVIQSEYNVRRNCVIL
jgi:translation initiation factor 3 subunit E